MLGLVSFTNTVAMFTKILDKTNLFVKLKTMHSWSFKLTCKQWLVDFDSIKRISVSTCMEHVGQFYGM